MRIVKVLSSALLALACGVAGTPATADGYALAWATNSCGGERMAGGNRVAIVNLGQLTIGASGSGQRMAALGVWSAELASPAIAASPAAVKLLPDGARLALGGLVVTSDAGCFPDRIYAEALDRSSGIALVGGGGEAALALEGRRVNVVGGVSTLNGERIMLNPMLAVVGQEDPLPPLWMLNRSVGGAGFGAPPLGQRGVLGSIDLNNVGLFVRTGGTVIDNSYVEYILINDGSWSPLWETGLRVAKANLGSVPEVGSYVIVTGISSVRVRGSILDGVVRPRKAGDMEVLLTPPPGASLKSIVRREEE